MVECGNTSADDERQLLDRARDGDRQALARLFERHAGRLRRMVELRLDPHLAGRIDPSDVLQDAYLESHRRLEEYSPQSMPFFLWLRLITGQKLTDLHRHHLGAKKRTAYREISLHRGAFPQATSHSLAAQLLGKVTTASQAIIRSELKVRVQEALELMPELDREVLALRHFEHLSNAEVAKVLGIKPNAASNRYVRALQRMGEILREIPGMRDLSS